MTRHTLIFTLSFAACSASSGDSSQEPGSSGQATSSTSDAPATTSDVSGSAATAAGGDSGSTDPGSDSASAGDITSGAAGCLEGAEVVTFETADSVTLEADFVRSGRAGGPAAVLLHMIPPSNDRTNYPPEFVETLHDAGYTVLNVDRRGAGGSGGNAMDAYQGPSGKEDAIAAIEFLQRSECAVSPSQVVIFGASNGTTTTIDYTVATTQAPRALVLLSPGQYTEAQTTVADNTAALDALPVFVGYPDSERAWSDGVRDTVGRSWSFHQYDGGSHGTRLFTSSPDVVDDILEFLETTE